MVTEEALGLPVGGRALLVEKLLASLAGQANSEIERLHLDSIRERRLALRSGKTKLIDGAAGMKKVRVALHK